ncbi:hypothetical protein FA95DRAFT_23882 [Auriscalpium vulgare]|uniref:Uncharacterized protein n=1 Tax=Auriscalpium vulgare TaxID=40419 RepID=A0ACB8SCV7_9AGAM|nr:hypothetical protein FA95DRAFT_23882 [Auriscalpium vulgare]
MSLCSWPLLGNPRLWPKGSYLASPANRGYGRRRGRTGALASVNHIEHPPATYLDAHRSSVSLHRANSFPSRSAPTRVCGHAHPAHSASSARQALSWTMRPCHIANYRVFYARIRPRGHSAVSPALDTSGRRQHSLSLRSFCGRAPSLSRASCRASAQIPAATQPGGLAPGENLGLACSMPSGACLRCAMFPSFLPSTSLSPCSRSAVGASFRAFTDHWPVGD